MVFVVLSLVVTGLALGALGRFIVPGRNPMSLIRTILVGLGGSVTGGLLGRLVRLAFHIPYSYVYLLSLFIAVAVTAVIVYLLQQRRQRQPS